MKNHHVALWSGLAAFFGSLVAIVTIDIFDPPLITRLAGAIFVASVTGAFMYAKQRLSDAQTERRIEDKKESL